jgi:hypothetical protein
MEKKKKGNQNIMKRKEMLTRKEVERDSMQTPIAEVIPK